MGVPAVGLFSEAAEVQILRNNYVTITSAPSSETHASTASEGNINVTRNVVSNNSHRPWNHGLFERVCKCGTDCWMTWCCVFIPLERIASKIDRLGESCLFGFIGITNGLLFVFTCAVILSVAYESARYMVLVWIYISLVAYYLRLHVRET